MFKIKYDFEKIFKTLEGIRVNEDRLKYYFLESVSDYLRANVQAVSKEKLGGRSKAFIEGFITEIGDDHLSIYLDEKARSIEKGVKSFDMKIGFKKSPKTSYTKEGGWYLTIPLRQYTPNSKKSGRMPAIIYKRAKSLAPGAALREASLPEVFKDLKTSHAGYQHKAPIYAGLQRKANADLSRSKYFTFRRVSEKSDPSSWIHPGFPPAKIMGQIRPSDIESVLQESLLRVLVE
jgi:hypothetical protein